MGLNALSSLTDGLPTDPSPVVQSRENGAWGLANHRFAEEVRELAAALSAYGLTPDQSAAVLGADGADTLRAALAVLTANATLVPLDPSIGDDALRRVLQSTGAVHAIASDERQLARILALRPDLPALDLVLLMAAAPSERKPPAMLVAAALHVGAARLADDPGCLARAVEEGGGRPAYLLVDTKGNTRAVDRGVFLALTERIGDALAVGRATTVLVALPYAAIERLAAVLAALSRGATILLSDPSERPDAGLTAHASDAMLLTVSDLERLYRAWIEDIEAKPWLARRLTRWALRRGMDSAPRNWKHKLADALVLRGLRAGLGGRVAALTVIEDSRGGASTQVESFFRAVGFSIEYLKPKKGSTLAR